MPNRRTRLLIYLFLFFANLTWAYLALHLYFFRGRLAACSWACRLFYLPCMGTFSSVFCIYGCQYSHTAWWKPIFIENCCFCKRIKPQIICNPDLIFGLAEHFVTLTLHTALPWYHFEKMCHPDLTFWPALLFGTWEYAGDLGTSMEPLFTHWPLGDAAVILYLSFSDWYQNNFLSISCEIAFMWLPQYLTTFVQVMAWCHPATSHYLIR